jgi:hypothetical protein
MVEFSLMEKIHKVEFCKNKKRLCRNPHFSIIRLFSAAPVRGTPTPPEGGGNPGRASPTPLFWGFFLIYEGYRNREMPDRQGGSVESCSPQERLHISLQDLNRSKKMP